MNSSKLCVASKFLETLVEDGKQHIEPKHLALGAITIRGYFGHEHKTKRSDILDMQLRT